MFTHGFEIVVGRALPAQLIGDAQVSGAATATALPAFAVLSASVAVTTTTAAAGRLWNPGDLASTVGWGTADTLSAGNVTSWGSINAVTEATNPPVYEAAGFNGKPSVLFDGTDDRLVGGAALAVANGNDVAFSAVIACQLLSTTAQKMIWSMGRSSSNTPNCMLSNTTNPFWRLTKTDDAATAANLGVTAADTNPHVISHVCAGTTLSAWLDGVAMFTNTAFNVGQTTLDEFALGCRLGTAGSQFANVRIRAWTISNTAVSTADRQMIEAWSNL